MLENLLDRVREIERLQTRLLIDVCTELPSMPLAEIEALTSELDGSAVASPIGAIVDELERRTAETAA